MQEPRELFDSLNMRPEIDFRYSLNDDGTMSIESDDASTASILTVFGNRPNDALILTSEEVDKLPHNMVHSFIYPMKEIKIEGQELTPDIILPSGFIIEITTRQSFSRRSLESAIQEKLSKYSEHARLGMCVVAVNRYECIDSLDMLSDLVRQRIQKLYVKSLRAMLEYNDKWGRNSTDPAFASMGDWPERGVESLSVRLDAYEKVEKMEWVQLLKSFQGRQKQTAIHLPMIQAFGEENLGTLDPSLVSGWRRSIWSCMLNMKYESFMSWEDLELRSNQKSDRKFPDQVKPKDLDFQDRLELALRGVRAKRMKHNPVIAAHKKRKKIPIDSTSDTRMIDDYIALEVKRTQPEDYGKITDFCQDGLVECLENLDLILREVALNAVRKLGKDEFIVRKVVGKPIYVVIVTTSYSTHEDKSLFYSVLARGNPYCPGMFERWQRCGNDWFWTDFVSTDRRRLEHLVSIPEQSIALRLMCEEQIGDLSPSFKPSVASWKPWKVYTMILLSDHSDVSETIQNLRYYYMSLHSGLPNSCDESLKIIPKMPQTCRSLIQLWLVKELTRMHPLCDLIVKPLEQTTEEGATDQLPGLETPFGFKIENIDLLLLASYGCNLRNKDRGNLDLDSKLILKKILSNEYEYRDAPPTPFAEHKCASMYSKFQASSGAIELAAELFKSKCVSSSGARNWKELATSTLNETYTNQTFVKVFSTKSSSQCDPGYKVDNEEMKDYDVRSKVFLELLKNRSELTDLTIYQMWDKILQKAEPDVSLFKKNQIGGVREIYILKFWFRLLVKGIEDTFRSLALCHPSEMLTKPSGRDSFVSKHFSECREIFGKDSMIMTLRFSGDMTNWANLLMDEFFEKMARCLLPANLAEVIIAMLKVHRKKRLHLPKPLLKSFLKSPGKYLDENLNRLRGEFLGKEDPSLMKEGSSYIECLTNMMQGILHYTSSVYHCMHLEYLKRAIENVFNVNELKCHVSFEVSSDDEGILVTLGCMDSEALSNAFKKLLRSFKTMKDSVDRLFGVRTSWAKSTTSTTELFEFNSTFSFGNNVSTPLIKFVARSIDDNPSETLSLRVASLNQSLRSIRDNGGSGALCHAVATLQNRALKKNLGWKVMPWFDNDFYEALPKFSFLGRYDSLEPKIAGLTNIEYQNWKAAIQDDETMRMYWRGGFKGRVEFAGLEISSSYRMFPRTKYLKALKSIGLAEIDRLSVEDLKAVFCNAETPEEGIRAIEVMARMPGIASSFSWQTRTDVVRLSAYLLYKPLFDGKTYRGFISRLREPGEGCPDMSALFPEQFEFSQMKTIENSESKFYKVEYRRFRKQKYYFPLSDTPGHRVKAKEVLSYVWFGRLRGNRKELERMFEKIKHDIPWMRNTPEETLMESKLSDYFEIASFMNSYSKHSNSRKMLSFSGGQKNYLLEAHRDNTYHGYSTTATDESSVGCSDSGMFKWRCLEGRFYAWSTLLASNRELPRIAEADLEIAISAYVDDDTMAMACRQTNASKRSFAKIIRSLIESDGQPILSDVIREADDDFMFYLRPQREVESVNGMEYRGFGRVVLKVLGCPVVFDLLDNNVTIIYSQENNHFIRSSIRSRGFYVMESVHSDISKPEDLEIKLQLGYRSGFRLVSEVGGYSMRFNGFPCSYAQHLPVVSIENQKPIDRFLSDYLNNSAETPNGLQVILRDKSLIGQRLKSMVRKLREGSRLIRMRDRMREPEAKEVMMDPISSNLLDLIDAFQESIPEEQDYSEFAVDEIQWLGELHEREPDTFQYMLPACLLQVASLVTTMFNNRSEISKITSLLTQSELDMIRRDEQKPVRVLKSIKGLFSKWRRS